MKGYTGEEIELHIRASTPIASYVLCVLRLFREQGYKRVRLSALGSAMTTAVDTANLVLTGEPDARYEVRIKTIAVRNLKSPFNQRPISKMNIDLFFS